MNLTSRRDGPVAVVEPSGTIAARAAVEFEREILKLLDEGANRFAIGFSQVELITSAGIRVLMMLAQRLQSNGGGLVLFALSNHVVSVFEVAGLMRLFRIEASEAAALAAMPSGGSVTRRSTRLTRLTARLIGSAPGNRPAGSEGQSSALTRELAALWSGGANARADDH